MPASPPLRSPAIRPHLIFRLGAHACGVPFSRVAEVLTLHATAPVLHPPDYGRGTVIVHGRPIPVLDLRTMMDAPCTLTTDTRLLVVWVDHLCRPDTPLGLLVDAVESVEHFAADDTVRPPDAGPDTDTSFIAGTIETPLGRRLLLNVDRLLPSPGPIPHFLADTAHFLPSPPARLRNAHERPIGTR